MNRLSFLILSASGGAGHLVAAEALHRTAQTLDLPIRTEHHDCLDFTSHIFKRLYSGTYLNLVNKTPALWGYFYQKAESKPYHKKGLLELFDHFNYRKYMRFLKSYHADAIVCTHFLPYISVSNEIRKAGIETPIFAVTTDFDIHQYWVDPIVYRYYVYHAESAWQLHSKGIATERIAIKGIPVMPEFLLKTKKSESRERLNIEKQSFTILVLSGGFGVGHVEEIVRTVVDTLSRFTGQRFNLIVVCGKNATAFSHVQGIDFPGNVATSIHGFVTAIPEMMAASDLVITKSGGLTSAEALVKNLPMIIIDPIPGQEMRNADLIIEHGAGWKAINLPNLAYKLTQVLVNPSLLKYARRSTQTLARPNAAKDILTDVYKHLHFT